MMSEFSTRVLELVKDLRDRKSELEAKAFDMRNKLYTIESEVKYIKARLDALKPLQEVVYAEEYLQGIKTEEG